MIGHQHIGVEIDPVFLTRITQMVEVELVVVIREETGASVVAPLDEVRGYSRKLEPWASRHPGSNHHRQVP